MAKENPDQIKIFTDRLKLFDIIIKKNPNDNETYYQKALVLIGLGKNEEALTCLEMAIKINPNELSYYACKAQIYVELDNYEQAEKLLKEININQFSSNIRNDNAKNIIMKVREELQKSYNNLTEKKQNLECRIEVLEEKNQKLEGRLENLENVLEKYFIKRINSSVEYKDSHSLNHQESIDDLLGNNA